MDVEVSILCVTYNQVDYVEQMLKSILAQETSFGIEILIHDDASTDGTAEILESYRRQYPEIIRVFNEKENRFAEYSSRGYFSSLLAPMARGIYIALCEGDDWWCNRYKLQKQYDYMQCNPSCSEFVHRARRIDTESSQTIDLMGMGAQPADYGPAEIIRNWCVPTSSRFIRRAFLAEYASKWVFDKPAGDFPLAVYLSSCGYTHHDPMVASVYRYRRPGSYSQRTLSADGIVSNAHRWLVMLSVIDERTNGLYHDALQEHATIYTRIINDHADITAARTEMGTEATDKGIVSLRARASSLRRRIHSLIHIPHSLIGNALALRKRSK